MNKFKSILLVIISITFLQKYNLHTQPDDFKFFGSISYNVNIPTPKSVLGFSIGEKPTRYDEAIRYFKFLAEKSAEVELIESGETYEKRKLHYLIISSEKNLINKENIRNSIAKLADPRQTNDAEAKKIAETTPAIAWMAYGIHGDELSSPDAAIQLAYQLAAGTDSTTQKIKNELIVLIDPMENPDGRERYLAQIQQWSGEVINSDAQHIQHTGVWPWGRGNHYLFDMNRDWFLLVHPETRARVKAILHWNPQLLVDAHEMGSYDTYLFSPAGPPLNPNINEFNFKWRKMFAQDQAKAFDQFGWSYYTREWNDEWYPGYGSGWSLYIGAVGILYEQAQTDGSIIKRPDGSIFDFRKAVHQQFISSMANLTTAASNRKDLLKEYFEAKKSDMKKLENQKFFILPSENKTRVNNLIDKLLLQNIEIKVAEKDFKVSNLRDYWSSKNGTKTLPKGTYIISLNQPMGRLAKTILEFDPRMDNETLKKERKRLEKEKRSMMYDITGWSIAVAYGVECYFYDGKLDIDSKLITESFSPSAKIKNSNPKYGYLFKLDDDKAIELVAKLLEKGFKLRSAKEPFEIEGNSFSRGTILIRLIENAGLNIEEVTRCAVDYKIDTYGVNTALSTRGPDLGGNDFVLLEMPKIALVTGSQISIGSFSTIWHLLDYRMKQRVTIITADALNFNDLRKYNVLILPSTNSPQTLNQLLGKDGISRLRKWIENGSTLIGIDNSAAFLADTSTGLSKVRLRHQALAELEPYSDWVKREDQFEKIRVDSISVWNGSGKQDTVKEKKQTTKDIKSLEREDEWMRTFTPRGAILSVDLDEEHWLAFGVGKKVPAIFYSSNAFLSKDPVQTVGRFSEKEKLRISGLVWQEAKERWAKTAYLTRESLGYGQIILFAEEPNFRSYFHGTERLLLNAIFLGSGFGTSRSVEW